MGKPIAWGLRVAILLIVLTVFTKVFVGMKLEPVLPPVPDRAALAHAAVPLAAPSQKEPPCYLASGVDYLEPIDCLSRGGSTTPRLQAPPSPAPKARQNAGANFVTGWVPESPVRYHYSPSRSPASAAFGSTASSAPSRRKQIIGKDQRFPRGRNTRGTRPASAAQ